jgi:hypothetical protein
VIHRLKILLHLIYEIFVEVIEKVTKTRIDSHSNLLFYTTIVGKIDLHSGVLADFMGA